MVAAVMLALLALPLPAAADFLEPVDVASASEGVPGLAGVLAVAVSRDGRHLYAAAPSDAAVATFRRDALTGSLAFASLARDGAGGAARLEGAADVALGPGDEHVYVAAMDANAVSVFRRDAADGGLTWLETHVQGTLGVDGLTYARTVAVSPDGAHVYVGGTRDGAIAVFARNGLTGTLRWLGVVRDGVDGVDGLAGVLAVTVSPDGRHVYAAGMNDGAIAVFRRDRAQGTLAFVEVHRDDVESLGIAGTHAVVVAPDGAHVYATGQADDAVAVFRRDAATGGLTPVGVVAEGLDGVHGLFGALALALSPDGAHAYVTGSLGNTVAVFRRDAASGALAFVAVEGRLTGVDTLAYARAVAVSPDGGTVYVGGASSNAVTAFRVVGR